MCKCTCSYVRVFHYTQLQTCKYLQRSNTYTAHMPKDSGMVDETRCHGQVPGVIAFASIVTGWWYMAASLGWVGTSFFGSSLPALVGVNDSCGSCVCSCVFVSVRVCERKREYMHLYVFVFVGE